MGLSNEYERFRDDRIAQNKARLEEFGLTKLSNSLRSSNCNKRKEKEKSHRSNEDKENFRDNNDDINCSLPNSPPKKIHMTRSDTRHRVYIPPGSMNKYTNIGKQGSALNDCSNTSQKDSRIEHQHGRQGVERLNISQNKSGKNITMAELLLQKKSLERANVGVTNRHGQPSLTLTKSLDGKFLNVDSHPSLDDDTTRLPVTRHEFEHQGCEDPIMPENLAPGNTDEEDTSSDSDEEATDYEIGQLHLDGHVLEVGATLEKKTRGPTMLHEVHTRPLEKRKALILNEFGQPVGPISEEEDTVGEFSRFLGTIARDYSYAPIVFRSWRKVPEKDKMWLYVLKKYVVPDEGKEWVLKTIGAAWRVYKCRFKAAHYYKYTDDKARWQNRSKRVPDEDFTKLLATWKKKEEKIRCAQNRARRLAQKNMHTAGPKSFATIREKMKNEHPNKEAPSLAEMFEHTRRRKEGKTYMDSYEDTANKLEQMKSFAPLDEGSGPSDEAFFDVMGKDYSGGCKLYGRGVTNSKLKKVAGTLSSYVVPTEILESLKDSLFEDMRNGMESEINKIQQMKKEMDEENARKKAELENMQRELNNQQENMTEKIMRKILEKLPPDVAREYLS